MGQFIATVILLETAPTAFHNIGNKFRIVLIILTAIHAILVYHYQPEPNGLTFEDVSVLSGNPVELSVKQTLSKEQEGVNAEHVEVAHQEKA